MKEDQRGGSVEKLTSVFSTWRVGEGLRARESRQLLAVQKGGDVLSPKSPEGT